MTQGPSSPQIEHGLIGAAIYFVECQAHLGKLDPSDFADPTCGRAWAAMQELAEKSRPIERVAVFQRIGVSVDDLDDAFMLAVDRIKTQQSPDALTLINAVRNMAGLRRMVNLSRVIQDQAWRAGAEAEDIARVAAEEINDVLAAMTPEKETFVTTPDLIEEVISALQSREVCDFVPTGLKAFDRITGGGLPRGDFQILGGQPSMGKTAVAMEIARKAALGGAGVLFISLEMTLQQTGVRLMASMLDETPHARSYLALMRQDPAVVDDPDFIDIVRHAMAAAKIPLSFDIRAAATIADIQSAVRKAQHASFDMGTDLKLVVVDYLNLMTASGRYHGNKVQEVGEILRGLKAMAKRENVALLVLAQLNRQSTNREGQAERPTMAHLRDSGEIEMHADAIFFAFRQAYNLERATFERLTAEEQGQLVACRNDLEIIIAKKRMGQTGSVTLWCDLPKNVVKDHPYATPSTDENEDA